VDQFEAVGCAGYAYDFPGYPEWMSGLQFTWMDKGRWKNMFFYASDSIAFDVAGGLMAIANGGNGNWTAVALPLL